MSLAHRASPTLAAALWPADAASPLLRRALLMVVGTLALWISAKIQVPLYPVPITMQTLAVLTLGVAYGWRLGTATLLLYLGEGAAGLPVFAGGWLEGGGIRHLAGPTAYTAGYLYGFVLAAALVGWLAERGWDRRLWTAVAAMIAGNVVIYLCGLPWLSLMIGFEKAVEVGLMPFLIGDALKIALGGSLLPLVWSLLRRPRG